MPNIVNIDDDRRLSMQPGACLYLLLMRFERLPKRLGFSRFFASLIVMPSTVMSHIYAPMGSFGWTIVVLAGLLICETHQW